MALAEQKACDHPGNHHIQRDAHFLPGHVTFAHPVLLQLFLQAIICLSIKLSHEEAARHKIKDDAEHDQRRDQVDCGRKKRKVFQHKRAEQNDERIYCQNLDCLTHCTPL